MILPPHIYLSLCKYLAAWRTSAAVARGMMPAGVSRHGFSTTGLTSALYPRHALDICLLSSHQDLRCTAHCFLLLAVKQTFSLVLSAFLQYLIHSNIPPVALDALMGLMHEVMLASWRGELWGGTANALTVGIPD